MTKQELLQHANTDEITRIITKQWSGLNDEENREYCLEEIYASLAETAPLPESFHLSSNDEKAQYEIDIDMLLITIEWDDIGNLIFDDGDNEAHFWSQVGDKNEKRNRKIYRSLFP
ncbi:hypothetical protein [Sulfurimonas sp. HSL3-7]|uniref:hypothetical protein n=1 Tax=Sulfonitrofixus jiaomeiensis TaxID=3131938 RepID=UPI0031F77110